MRKSREETGSAPILEISRITSRSELTTAALSRKRPARSTITESAFPAPSEKTTRTPPLPTSRRSRSVG